MTFGALSAGPRSGPQLMSCTMGGAEPSESLLLMADGAHGLVSWRLSSGFMHADKSEDELELGVDSRRASRVLLPDGPRVLCLALSQPSAIARAPMLACGCDDGTLILLAMAPVVCVDGTDMRPPDWAVRQRVRFGDEGNRVGVVQIAWAYDGATVYAGIADGSVHALTVGL
jgi:hypothetical protein